MVGSMCVLGRDYHIQTTSNVLSSQQVRDLQSFVAVPNMLQFICLHNITVLHALNNGKKNWFMATVPVV